MKITKIVILGSILFLVKSIVNNVQWQLAIAWSVIMQPIAHNAVMN